MNINFFLNNKLRKPTYYLVCYITNSWQRRKITALGRVLKMQQSNIFNTESGAVLLFTSSSFNNFRFLVQYLFAGQDEKSLLYNVSLETPRNLLNLPKFKISNRMVKRRREKRRLRLNLKRQQRDARDKSLVKIRRAPDGFSPRRMRKNINLGGNLWPLKIHSKPLINKKKWKPTFLKIRQLTKLILRHPLLFRKLPVILKKKNFLSTKWQKQLMFRSSCSYLNKISTIKKLNLNSIMNHENNLDNGGECNFIVDGLKEFSSSEILIFKMRENVYYNGYSDLLQVENLFFDNSRVVFLTSTNNSYKQNLNVFFEIMLFFILLINTYLINLVHLKNCFSYFNGQHSS